MTTISSAPTTTAANATALTPPHSSHGNEYAWDASGQQVNNSIFTQNGGAYYGSTNDTTVHDTNEKGVFGGEPLHRHQTAPESVQLSVPWDGQKGLDESPMERHRITQNASANDLNKKAAAKEIYGSDPDDVSSKWIHRDKLARIENEELQAAGIILPKARARSRPRRDVSVDRANGHRTTAVETDTPFESRSRRSSFFSERKAYDANLPSWDLRLPEEIDAEAYFIPAGGNKGVSRIPVAKLSPAPIPLEHIERDSMLARKRGNSLGAEDSIVYLKPRSRSSSGRDADGSTASVSASPQRNGSRSVSDSSPKKSAASVGASGGSISSTSGARKTSTSSKANSVGRPKTRNGPSKEANGSAAGGPVTRPSTRSGERELSPGASGKHPEGEPPWMISAYRPDPRLPPDQQLLPTVAKRLQQEKWEREGKFGNIYDKEFRPLTENGFLTPPEASDSATAAAPTSSLTEEADHWPLKPETRSSTTQIARTGSYSTIPKIQDKPSLSPLPSPLGPTTQALESRPRLAQAAAATAAQDDDAKGGCGCCVVM